MTRFFVLALALVFAATAATPQPLSRSDAGTQVRQAAALLFTSFYRKLSPHDVIAAEHDALADYLKRNHASSHALPAVPAHLSSMDAPAIAADEVNAALSQKGIAQADAVAVALKAITGAAHDRYTTFFTAREYRDFDEVLDPAKLSGIGVLLDTDPQSKFVRAFFVVPETPADRAGMRSGDLIQTIEGNSTKGWSVAEARKHLLGKTGTPLHLTFAHPGDSTATDVAITRAEVQPPTVYFQMLPDQIAYVYVAAFGNATPHEFHNAIERSEAAGARAYVLDLRNDGGGIVGTALSISSTFIPSGPLVSIESNAGEIDTYEADNEAIPTKPLAVLVNGYSASASEITAAAIAESGTGTLVGTKTFGKGVVQSVTKFPDGSAIKITTGRYYTPLNHDINGHGIVPGVVVEENPNAVFGKPEQDAQLRKALDLIGNQLSQNPGTLHT